MNARLKLPLVLTVAALGIAPLMCGADFVQINLVSNLPNVALAPPDPSLINPWGVSFSATSPFWVSNQGSNTSTLYNPTTSPIKLGLTVNAAGGPTGQVFNSTASSFMIPGPNSTTVKSSFIFDTLSGTIQGWNPGSTGGTGSTVVAASQPGAVFTGLALDTSNGSNYLYAADATGSIRVYNSTFQNVSGTTFAGKFVDPNAIPGFTPYNIQNLNGNIYVTYAESTNTGAPLPGGFVDEYDAAGDFIKRVGTNGVLNAPWGLAIAPAGFGNFGGDLLVGNVYNSVINAIDPSTAQVVGSITVNTGFASSVGLWALDFGNGASGSANTLYFTDGINNQTDGLFGEINVAPEPASLMMLPLGAAAFFAFRRRHNR